LFKRGEGMIKNKRIAVQFLRLLNFLTFLFTLCPLKVDSQPNLPQKEADSLWEVWKDETKPDSSRLKAIHSYAINGYLYTKPDSAFYYADLQFEFASNNGLQEQMAEALNTKGLSFYFRGDYKNAYDYYLRSIELSEKLDNQKVLARTLGNMGILYRAKGDYTKALDFYSKSLKIFEAVDYKRGISFILNNIAGVYKYLGEYDKAVETMNKCILIEEELGNLRGMAASLGNIGIIYQDQGNYDQALEYYNKSLQLKNKTNDKQGIAITLDNIGVVYQGKGLYVKALEHHSKSLHIREELGDKKGIALSLINIGLIHQTQENHHKALEQFVKSLSIYEELGDKQGIATALGNIGTVYENLGDNSKALKKFSERLNLEEELGHKKGVAQSLGSLGKLYQKKGDFEKAFNYFTRSLEISEELGDKKGIVIATNNLGNLFIEKGDYGNAIQYNKQSLALAQELGLISGTLSAAKSLWKIYKVTANFKEALLMHELYIASRDSILAEENKKELIRQEYKYEYEKQAAADSVRAAEAEKVANARISAQNAQLEKEQTRGYALSAGIVLLFLFGGFMYNRFRVTNKQKLLIEKQEQETQRQKEIIEEAHREITDSIAYAKRIQGAILPPLKIVKKHLESSFILYKPKDVVAGDFYWMTTSASRLLSKPEFIYFAAADCTGHGVPGAMVSVVCNNALNRSVKEFGLTEPGEILDKTRELVIQEFEKSEEEVQDGMDIALCSLSKSSTRLPDGQGVEKFRELKYAGAHNPLWLIRKGEFVEAKFPEGSRFSQSENGAYQLVEVRADKQPIGKYETTKPYTTHTFQLEGGDTLYLFSDGFVDQFGGVNGKKFKSLNFKQLLLSIQKEDMDTQSKLIDEAFENWKQDIEQVDDVCVIGVRI